MKNCAIYTRVSTSEQSCELQIRELKEFAERRGWNVIIAFEEKMSGTTANRPQLKQLQKLVSERKIDVVLTWKLDRLFRSLKDLLSVLQDWSDLGVEMVSLRDNIDLTTSTGRLLMQIVGAFGEFEAALVRERVRAGVENARKKGVKLGRPVLQLDIGKVRDLRSKGLPIRAIALELGISVGSVQKAIKSA
ncbi:MAG: recombinase family protein [Pseudobdellovibrionaceae bacterium]